MTVKQSLLKWIYPITMQIGKWMPDKKNYLVNLQQVIPPVDFYTLHAIQSDGSVFNFSSLHGEKVLLVNTASNCGFTAQYNALQKLYETYKDRLIILAFPSNDFKNQEPDTNANIKNFCSLHYGVQFQLMQKSVVVKSQVQHPVFQWLSDANRNGWNNQAPVWNFNKYLVNEAGMLTHYFSSFVSPLSPKFLAAIKQ
ncbi:glutathione peroxidase [Hydrotalea sp.]|uniref:glutathione peroxidase n=1 Tax=Hydrotalea sp. TaxID=2881279 RepID=UPI00258EC1E5|nr:glutathione peroxidase [Hydrotalea sp.]